jgi:hypothetical protein
MLRAALVSAIVTLVLVAGATAAGPPRLVGNCVDATVRPSTVILFCGDAGGEIDHIRWLDWGSAVAVGNGTIAVNPCTPDCASTPSSRWVRAKVVVLASHLGSCRGGVRAYQRLTYAFPGNGPVPPKLLRSSDAFTQLDCPAA